MSLVVLGLNHTTAPVEARERVFVTEERLPDFFHHMKDRGFGEVVVLSTCNRTEIYLVLHEPEETLGPALAAVAAFFDTEPQWFTDFLYTFRDEEAYRHLFVVASGLDSMVVGEPQILGQVKDSYRLASDHDATGFLLDKVFHRTFTVAKRIRTETKIGYNPVSISSMAVEMSKKIFGHLPSKKILVLGAGEMCEIALKHFRREGVAEVFIVNRTFQNARKLAEEVGGTPYSFDAMPEVLTMADMVLTSTGSEKPIIGPDLVQVSMKKRKNRPLFFIDIAVPRDVDPAVNDLENVYLYDIDDLRDLSMAHLSDRLKESEKAQEIVSEEVRRLAKWLKQLDLNPLIAHIYERAEQIRAQEVQKSLKKLKAPDDETIKAIDALTKTIVNKMLHPHVTLLKEDGSPPVLEIVKRLFSLEDENNEEEVDRRNEGQ